MHAAVLFLHSWLRWVVVFLGVAAVLLATPWPGMAQGRPLFRL